MPLLLLPDARVIGGGGGERWRTRAKFCEMLMMLMLMPAMAQQQQQQPHLHYYYCCCCCHYWGSPPITTTTIIIIVALWRCVLVSISRRMSGCIIVVECACPKHTRLCSSSSSSSIFLSSSLPPHQQERVGEGMGWWWWWDRLCGWQCGHACAARMESLIERVGGGGQCAVVVVS